MVEFSQWHEALIFSLIISTIILVPSVLLAILGRRMMNQLGLYPSKAPSIVMSYCIPISIIVCITYSCLFMFYLFFSN